MGSSLEALAAEEDPQGRGIGTLIVEAEAGSGGGREEGEGGAGEVAAVLNSENDGRIRWQPSLIGRMSKPDQPRGRRSVRGCCTSYPVKALARAVGKSSCKISKTWKVRQ